MTPRRITPRRRKILIFTTTFLIGLVLVYGGSVVSRSHDLYGSVKSSRRGWSGRILRSDPVLGIANTPGAIGAETYPIGPDVPSRIDRDGLRVPVDSADPPVRSGPLVLALGCSFTYGSSVLAEETFSHIFARAIGGSEMNAGICGGGAAQMLVRARELIQSHRPAFVLAQFSPWLAERSRADHAPTYEGLVPTPRFIRGASGMELRPPGFGGIAFDVPVSEYRSTEKSTAEFMSFLGRVGAPLLVHDDFARVVLSARRIGSGDEPTLAEIEAHVYLEIAHLCRESGSQLVLVWLEGRPPGDPWAVPSLAAELGVPIAAGTKRMVDELETKTREVFVATYTLMRGDPPRCVDAHPNARAHALIADEISRAIR